MYYVQVQNNVRLAVEDINPCRGPTVLLVHGWPLSRKIFEYQVNAFTDAGYRVVTFDLRGFGQSSTSFDGYSYSQLATDLYNVILNLQLQNIILGGFSMGGAIVLRYMSLFKGFRVAKLALIAAAAPSFVQRPDYPYGMTAEDVNKLIDLSRRDRPQMAAEFGEMLFAKAHTLNLKDYFKDISWSASGIGTIKTAISLRDEDLRGDMQNVHVPTGIFHGKMDKVCPYVFGEILHKGICNSVLYTYEKSGHAVFYDALENFNQDFLSFIQQ